MERGNARDTPVKAPLPRNSLGEVLIQRNKQRMKSRLLLYASDVNQREYFYINPLFVVPGFLLQSTF